MNGGKKASAPVGDRTFILNSRREKVELVRVGMIDPAESPGLMARVASAFFGGQPAGKAHAAMAPRIGPPPAVFREAASGLLHVVYREIVIRFVRATPEKRRRAILRNGGFKVRRANSFIPNQVVVHDPRRRHSGEALVEVSNRWMGLDDVVFATPNFVSEFRRQGPPSIRSEEWHLSNPGGGGAKVGEDVNVSEAWERTAGDPGIVVAVLDDGVDVDHPNLAASIWRNPDESSQDKIGRDFFASADDPEHFNPRPKRFTFPFHLMAGNDIHGTPCAGIIAAAGRNGGSVGVAPRCRLLPVKIFQANDLVPGESVANAIRYAAAHADILSCSWSSGINPDIELALEDAGELGREGRGAAVFCAAGNDYGSPVSFPAREPHAIAVGASTDQGKRAPYSNIGPEIAFVAPSSGGIRDIFTTGVSPENRGFCDGEHTDGFGGTSAATALAAGVAALVLSVRPDLSRGDLRDLLTETAERIGPDHDPQGHSQQLGFGRINAGSAVALALSTED